VTPEALRALTLRQTLSKSSVKKLDAIVSRVSPDGRLRNNYVYYGAHTGRWSGTGVQLQNLPREASVWGGQEVNIRSCFQAPEGYKFVVADLAAIETRVLAWLTQCPTLLSVFAEGRDPYVDFAAFMYRCRPEDVTKDMRQIAKSAVLGCGYMLSGGEECVDKNGDEYKSGLWGYAENMGIQMPQATAHDAVLAYRERYREVVDFWYKIEDAAVNAVWSGGMNGGVNGISFGSVPGKVLYATLPSGRRLHYLNPKLGPGKYKRPELTHETHGTTTGWIREKMYGGIWTENAVQAIARDVLAVGMLRAAQAGFTIVGHCHDELVCLETCDRLEELIHCMTAPMPWALDLPLAAEGYSAKIYRK
jgi:DNA polymerase